MVRGSPRGDARGKVFNPAKKFGVMLGWVLGKASDRFADGDGHNQLTFRSIPTEKFSANENWKIILKRPARGETHEKVFYSERKILVMLSSGCEPSSDRFADGDGDNQLTFRSIPTEKFSAYENWKIMVRGSPRGEALERVSIPAKNFE